MAYIWGSSKAPNYLIACGDYTILSDVSDKFLKGEKVNEEYVIYEIDKPSAKQALTLKEKLYGWDVLSTNRYAILVNQKVLNILNIECAGKFQAIPAIIKLPDGDEVKDYFAINVTNKVPLFSIEDSVRYPKYSHDINIRGAVFSIKSYKSAVIEKEDLCKDDVIESGFVFVSERLRNILQKEKVKGPQFWESLSGSVILI